MIQFVEKGTKDSSVEVREICKNILFLKEETTNIKKIPIVFKIESKEEIKIKDLKIKVEEITKTSSNELFYEKLSQLKKERAIKQRDELTPRKLDIYLNKFRKSEETNKFSLKILPNEQTNSQEIDFDEIRKKINYYKKN